MTHRALINEVSGSTCVRVNACACRGARSSEGVGWVVGLGLVWLWVQGW